MKVVMLIALLFVLCGGVCQEAVAGVSSADMKVMRISSQDQRAVVRAPDGTMQVIKVGDSFGENGKVTEITEGRIVIEERTDKGVDTVIIRVVEGKPSVERIKRTGEPQPLLQSSR